MKKFRTIIDPVHFDFEINHQSKSLLMGSCFTENIGKLLEDLKFDVNINPFGILYNPVSITKALNYIVDNKKFEENKLFFFNERWNSFSHHGKFSLPNKTETLKTINNRISEAFEVVNEINYLFITLGTAWVYELKETNEIVANCHKYPNTNFNKRQLSVNEITKPLINTIKRLKEINDKLKVIFTISPVRHLKDGFVENFISKSTLRVAVENIKSEFNSIAYFPAYEILSDDLRDYRFYESDMIHPSKFAVDYIFDYFKSSFFNTETNKLNKRLLKILKAKLHKPFNMESAEYQKFKLKMIHEVLAVQKQYPYIDLEDEYNFFQ